MNAYAELARFYDALTGDVPYKAMADYYERVFARRGIAVKSILDLACGTGTMTALLAERGYDMIGTDASIEMLSQAAGKTAALANRPLFLHQAMERLDLYGTVDAVVSALDGINYAKPDDLPEIFRRIRLFLEPGGSVLTGKFLSTRRRTSFASGAPITTRRFLPAVSEWISLPAPAMCGRGAPRNMLNTHTSRISWRSSFWRPDSSRRKSAAI